MTFLPAFIQWLHVGSVVLLIGGFFFLRVILLPSTSVLPDSQKPKLVEAAFRRFRVVVWIALVTTLMSGIYNFIVFLRSASTATQDPSVYILVLGIKLFIVFLIFTFGVLLTFPYPVFAPIQKRPSPWLNLTLFWGLIVIFLSTLLRRL